METIAKKLAKKIGKRISAVRRDKKKTSELLAYETGISKGYLSDIENGNKLPTILLLYKLSRTLGVSVKTFFEGI